MTVYDSDVLSDLIFGRRGPPYNVVRSSTVPRFAAVVSVEEQLRGLLSAIKRASQSHGGYTLSETYDSLNSYMIEIARYKILAYSTPAHELFKSLKHLQHKVGTRDLRIASICLAHDATLATRNKWDFEQVPNLKLDV